MASQEQLRTVSQLSLYDRLMQSRVVDALVTNLANVNGIGKQCVERSPEKRVPTRSFTVPCNSHFRSEAATIQILHQEPDGTEFQVALSTPVEC